MNLGTVSAAVVVSVAGLCGSVMGQSFPIRAAAEPAWLADLDTDVLPWQDGLGTIERVGDLNGDGVDDLLVLFAGYSNGIAENRWMYLYLGNRAGDGSVSFGAPEQIEGFDLEGDFIGDVVIHDHNSDGLNDLLFISNLRHSIEVWVNTESGFTPGMTLLAEGLDTGDTQRILIEDIDLDGDDDYLVYDCDSSAIWSKQTNENYSLQVVAFAVYEEYSAAITDVDGDGDLDLVSHYPGDDELYGTLQIDGQWFDPDDPDKHEEDYEFEASLAASNFDFGYGASCFADVNGDGMMDLVAFGGSDDNDSEFAFGLYLSPFIDDSSQVIPVLGIPEMENGFSRDFRDPDEWERGMQSPGDLDGDGTDDFLYFPFQDQHWGWRITDALNLNGRRAVYNELDVHGEGLYELESDPEYDDFAYRDVFSDVNGDGVKDRIVPTAAERFDYSFKVEDDPRGIAVWSVLANPMKRDVVFTEQDAIDVNGSLSHVIALDLDLDGDQEIIVNRDAISLVDRDVDGRYKYDRFTRMTGGPNGFRTVVAQLDDDPTPDLLSLRLGSGFFAPTCFLNPMLSGFSSPILQNPNTILEQELDEVLDQLGIGFFAEDNSFSTGDVDGDGTTDIVIRGRVHIDEGYEGESVLVWLNDGTGQFSVGPISPVGDLGGTRTYNMELIDADQDGMLDVVCVVDEDDLGGYAIETYVNDGSGSFVLDQSMWVEMVLFVDLEPYWIAVEDVDSDGIDDVSVLFKDRDAAHEVIIAYGGEEGLEEQLHRWAGGNAAEILFADLDGDGMKDLLSCSYEDEAREYKNSVSVMFQGAAREFGPMVSIADVNLSGVNVADLDSDGGLDLIVCSNGTNDPRVVRVYYGIDDVCPADMNFDGSLNYMDIALFVKLVGEGREAADLDRDGVLGFDDISLYLDLYINSCS
jgi:FG-GAP-like repeat